MKKSKSKKWIIIGVVLLVVAVVAAVLIKAAGSVLSKAAMPVTVTTAFRGDLQDTVSASGTIASENKKVIFSKVNGLIDQVNVEVGQEVKAGAVLISYQLKNAENALEQATLQQDRNTAAYNKALAGSKNQQAKLNEANINLGVLEQQISDCESYLAKLQEELSESQRVTGNNLAGQIYDTNAKIDELKKQLAELTPDSKAYKTKSKELEEAVEKLSQLEYQRQIAGSSDYVAQTQRDIQKAQEQLANLKEYQAEMKSQKVSSETQVLDSYDKKQLEVDSALAAMNFEAAQEDYELIQEGVKAEFDGIVTECMALPGSMVSQGMQLLTLESSREIMVDTAVSKNNLEKIAVGQKADIRFNGQEYTGQVSAISHVATVGLSGTPMVNVRIHMDDPGENLILGLEAKAEIYTRKAENVLLVPMEVVNADRDGDFVYVVKDGVVERRSVVCGISADLYTEIIEGLTESDQIVWSSPVEIKEGMAVTIMPGK